MLMPRVVEQKEQMMLLLMKVIKMPREVVQEQVQMMQLQTLMPRVPKEQMTRLLMGVQILMLMLVLMPMRPRETLS